MSEFTKNKNKSAFVTILIGIIVLSFMFTGYQSFQQGSGSPNTVGKVGDLPIKVEEYQQEYNRQLEFYKQMMGGEISTKQIEAMNLKETAIKNLIQKKLIIKLANEIGSSPSEEEIKTEIKTLPYFLTNGQFDLNRYKMILAANKLTTQDFEADVINQVKTKNTMTLLQTFPLSKSYLADLQKIKEDKLDAEIISINKNKLREFITISKDELSKYLTVETNLKRLQSLFNERKSSLDKPEEVKARHILIMGQGKSDADLQATINKIAKEVTPLNFAKMADKYTEDPSGKGKGGDLGLFSKGRMVPEFEQVAFTIKPMTISAPIKTQYGYHLLLVEKKNPGVEATFNEYKEKLALEIIQKDKIEEIKKLSLDISNQLKKALENGSENEIKATTAKYKLSYSKGSINRLDGASNAINLTPENMQDLFSGDLLKTKVHLFDNGSEMIMIKAIKSSKVLDPNELSKLSADSLSLKNTLAKKMIDAVLKRVESDTNVKINSNLF